MQHFHRDAQAGNLPDKRACKPILLRKPTLCQSVSHPQLPGAGKSIFVRAPPAEHIAMQQKSFTPDDPALPMNYPGFVYRTLREDGFPANELLAETRLDEAHLSDPHFRCGFRSLRRLFLNAIERIGDPDLGVMLALKFQPTHIGLPAYTAMNAGRFADGLDVLKRFYFLNFPAFELQLVEESSILNDGEAAIRLRSKFPFWAAP